jgi:hypothetical protein
VPSSEENERDRGGMRPIEIFGIRHAIDFGRANVFRAAPIDHVTKVGKVTAAIILAGDAGGTFAASNARCENDFLADVDGGDFRADLGDFAGNIAARNVRERDGDAGKTTANPKVKTIKGAGAHADEDFIVAENRFGDVGIAKDRGITVLMDDDGFHGQPPGSAGTSDGSSTYIVSRYVGRLTGGRIWTDCWKITIALLRSRERHRD